MLYSFYKLNQSIDCSIIVIIRAFSLLPILSNSTFLAIESFFILIKGVEIPKKNRFLTYFIFFLVTWLPAIVIMIYILLIKPNEDNHDPLTCAISSPTFQIVLAIVVGIYYLLMFIFYIKIIVFLCRFSSGVNQQAQKDSKKVLQTIWLYIVGFIILLYFVSFTVSTRMPEILQSLIFFNLFGFSCLLPFINWIFVWSQKIKVEILAFYCRKQNNDKEIANNIDLLENKRQCDSMGSEMSNTNEIENENDI